MTDKKDKGSADFGAFPPPSAKLKSRPSSRRTPAFDPELGSKLRAMYGELMDQPIPERFVELLEQLDRARENKSQ